MATFVHPDLTSTAVLDALAADGFTVEQPTRRTRTALDTFDGRIHAAGLRLEAHGPSGATLVLSGEGAASPAHLSWVTTLTWPDELPPGPFRSRLADITVERALLPLLTVTARVRTARRTDRRGKATVVVEVHDDLATRGREASGLPSVAVEVVSVVGHPDPADAASRRVLELGLVEAKGDLLTIVAEAAGVSLSGRSSSPTVPLDPDEDALTAFRAVLANLAVTIDDNLEGTADDIDSEFLHELRVAVRRTRSVLAQGKGVLPPDVRDRYRGAFGWLGEVTGPPRDLDVYLLGWADYVAPLAEPDAAALARVRTELEARRIRAHHELSTVLRGAKARGVLDGWRDWLSDPDVVADESQPVGPIVVKRIHQAQERVLRDGRAITPASPAERLHDLRKDTKKLRYLLECFGTLFPSKPRKAFVAQLKALQDNLGEHQDAEIHVAALRDLAHDLHEQGAADADALLAMGRLSDHLDRLRAQEREAFATRFAAYDTKANRSALDDVLGKAASR